MKRLPNCFTAGRLKNQDTQYNEVSRSCSVNRQSQEYLPMSIIFAIIIFILICVKCQETLKSESNKLLDSGYLLNNPDLESLGEKLFFDANLSTPEGQSCAACHNPEVGWTGPDEEVNKAGAVYRGAMHQRSGNRKPNSSAYASLSPVFYAFREDNKVLFAGGNFWDGRATGYNLGNPAADQAQGPFLNPVEQNVADAKTLVGKVCGSEYASLYKKVGTEIWKEADISTSKDVNLQFGIIGLAIAAFENSQKVNSFSSKYDYYLKGKAKLTAKENEGLELFRGKAKCINCHAMGSHKEGEPPLFTDFTYENIGMPKNPQNPWYAMDTMFNKDGANWVDPGLAETLKKMPQFAMYADENYGKHQVPSLRNVDKRPSVSYIKCYGHNGYFKSLEEIVHFYNMRDILPPPEKVMDPKPGVNCWPGPEITKNINKTELGNLGLTTEEESAVVEFLKTLSDGYVP
jgi:cytochrome c peroxidase